MMPFYRLATAAIPRHRIPGASLVVALGITVGLVAWSVQIEKVAGHREFRRLAEKFQVDLSNQIQAHIDTIPTLKAFAVLERYPSDARVKQFISAISLRQRFPNLAFIFLADRVALADRQAYTEAVRNDASVTAGGHPHFAIFPDGDRAEFLVIRHVFPGMAATVGYDLYDPTQHYREEVDAAVTTGGTVATGPIVLAKDRLTPRNADNTSIVVRAPVFAHNLMPDAAHARAGLLQGVVGIAFRTNPLIDSVMTPGIRARLGVRVADSAAPASALPLFDNLPPDRRGARSDADPDQLSLPVSVANRRWIISARDRLHPSVYWSRPIPIIIFSAGAAIAVLLWLLMRALVTRTSIAEAAVKDALILVRNEQKALEEAQAIASIGSFEWDVASNRLSWSAQMVRLYGCTAAAFCADQEALLAQIPPEERSAVRRALSEAITRQAPFALEHTLRHANGDLLSMQIRSKWQYDRSGKPCLLSGTAQEITALRKHEAEITRLAFTDALTGLRNRRYMIDRLALVLEEARRDNVLHALLFLDLDNFKIVNDTKGHAVGDQLLGMVAERIKRVVPEGDIIARIGGDEFVVLTMVHAPSVQAAAAAAAIAAERVRTALAEPFSIDGTGHVASASIGVSVFPQSCQTYADIFREADTAMYRSKASGRNQISFFAKAMQTEIEKKAALGVDLADAVRCGALELVAQQQFDVHRQPRGAELLLRWRHPGGESIAPERFIPLAEETGLIVPLGAWVFEQGCKAVIALAAAGCSDTVSINVSPRQFRQPEFVAMVRDTLARLKVPPQRLIFEITEGLLIDNVAETARRMHALSALGIRFSIDDFGTGYSSLAYLKDLPLYELKIDKAFLHAASTNAHDAAIVRLILGIAAQLGIQVVAEGVESQAQFDFLAQNGCTLVQGFWLAQPTAMPLWLSARTRRVA